MTQEDALNILKLGHSVFLTGGAGSGKTYVLNQYIKWLKSHVINTAVTASTGIAATHISGVTIHSWSGIGIKDHLSEYDIDELEQKKALYTRYKSTQVLIIDEISMLHAHRLDMVDLIARTIRKDERPFGGMQVVFCGDFFQLPPVSKNKNIEIKDFAFNAKVWKKLNPVVCYLTTEYRHTGDSLSLLLRDMRSGILEDHHKKTLLVSTKKSVAHTTHTKLFTHNEDVDRINDAEYSLIEGDEKVFEMITKGKSNLVDSLMQNCLAPEILKLKVGTRVMFVKNDQGKRYNNGTLGIVSKFTNLNVPIVKTVIGEEITVTQDVWRIEEDGKIKAEIKQLPLRYAWAITVHKSQGMTLDAAQIDLSKTFTFGMGYVALSRVRTIEGVELLGFHDDALIMHPEILRLDKDLHERSITS
jgi:ATP-dependent exoDNAse (exonuclease V) alpha subunit